MQRKKYLEAFYSLFVILHLFISFFVMLFMSINSDFLELLAKIFFPLYLNAVGA